MPLASVIRSRVVDSSVQHDWSRQCWGNRAMANRIGDSHHQSKSLLMRHVTIVLLVGPLPGLEPH